MQSCLSEFWNWAALLHLCHMCIENLGFAMGILQYTVHRQVPPDFLSCSFMQYSNFCVERIIILNLLYFIICGVHHKGKSLTNAKLFSRLPFERESWQPDCVDIELNRAPKVTRHNFQCWCVVGFGGSGLFLISRTNFLEVASDSAKHSTHKLL